MSFSEAMAILGDQFGGMEVSGLNMAREAQRAHVRGLPETYAANIPPAFINREGYISLHRENTSAAPDGRNGTIQYTVKQTMRPHIQHGCAPPILPLRPTTLREVALKVNHIHEDRIMFVRTIHDAHSIVGTNMLVEDDNGDCLMLSVYNFVASNEDPKDFFPLGSYLALLAPYMKNSGDDPRRNLLLRCDNPECVRIFPSRRSWLAAKRGKKLIDTDGLDPAQLRTDGNRAFTDGRYEAAARLYCRALDCKEIITQDDKLACLGNLAEVRIRQEQWEAAEKHATSALELAENHTKAKFRLATAQLRLNKIDKAAQLIADQKEKAFQRLRDDIFRLLNEQCGVYNFVKMQMEAAKHPGEALSTFHADYTSPNIQRSVQISKRNNFVYRGTVATDAIKKSTLISSSKAVVFCRNQGSSMGYNIDPYAKSILKGSHMELENKLIYLMYRRPEKRGEIYALSSGFEHPASNGNEKIDTKRIQGIVTSNTFGATEEDLVHCWKKYQNVQAGKPPLDPSITIALSGSGLWVNESLFNHSCVPNCTWKQIGDQIFIWTSRDVEATEELTLSYVSPEHSYSEREETFRNWVQPNVGFSCQCDWCHAIRTSIELQQVEKRVHDAYRTAAELVSSQQIKMALAAERVMPAQERQACIKILSKLPQRLQHNASANLWVLEGVCLAHAGDFKSALEAYEKAAKIKYAVRGGINLECAKDLWRIVGASMACGYQDKALAVLCSIYQDIFIPSSLANIQEVFYGLTLTYSLPWWQDSYDMQRQSAIEALISKAVGANKTKPKSSKKRR